MSARRAPRCRLVNGPRRTGEDVARHAADHDHPQIERSVAQRRLCKPVLHVHDLATHGVDERFDRLKVREAVDVAGVAKLAVSQDRRGRRQPAGAVGPQRNRTGRGRPVRGLDHELAPWGLADRSEEIGEAADVGHCGRY